MVLGHVAAFLYDFILFPTIGTLLAIIKVEQTKYFVRYIAGG